MEFVRTVNTQSATSQLVVIECVVNNVTEIENGRSEVELKGCIVRDYDENTLISDSAINRPPIDTLVATTLTRYCDFLPLKSGPETVIAIVAEVTGDQYWLKTFACVDDDLNEVQRLFLEFKDGIAQGKNVRETSSLIGLLVKKLNRALNFSIVPIAYCKNDALSLVTNLESEWRELVAANLNLIKSDSEFDSEDTISLLRTMQTSRSALRDYYLNHLEINPDDSCHVAFKGTIKRIEPGIIGYKHRIIYENVQVIEYSNLNDPNLCDTIQELDHLNVFIDDINHLSVGQQVYRPARCVVYKRSQASADASGLDRLDIGLQQLKFARLGSWLDEIHANLCSWKDHLNTVGIAGSGKFNKDIKNRFKLLQTPSDLLIDNSLATIDEFFTRIDDARNEYAELQELSAQKLAESNAESQRRWEEWLFSLTMEAMDFLAKNPITA